LLTFEIFGGIGSRGVSRFFQLSLCLEFEVYEYVSMRTITTHSLYFNTSSCTSCSCQQSPSYSVNAIFLLLFISRSEILTAAICWRLLPISCKVKYFQRFGGMWKLTAQQEFHCEMIWLLTVCFDSWDFLDKFT